MWSSSSWPLSGPHTLSTCRWDCSATASRPPRKSCHSAFAAQPMTSRRSLPWPIRASWANRSQSGGRASPSFVCFSFYDFSSRFCLFFVFYIFILFFISFCLCEENVLGHLLLLWWLAFHPLERCVKVKNIYDGKLNGWGIYRRLRRTESAWLENWTNQGLRNSKGQGSTIQRCRWHVRTLFWWQRKAGGEEPLVQRHCVDIRKSTLMAGVAIFTILL